MVQGLGALARLIVAACQPVSWTTWPTAQMEQACRSSCGFRVPRTTLEPQLVED